MEELVNKMTTIAERLAALGKPVSDEEMAMILLTSLPKDYNHLITTLETLDDDKI